jgi:hypothetical protein
LLEPPTGTSVAKQFEGCAWAQKSMWMATLQVLRNESQLYVLGS